MTSAVILRRSSDVLLSAFLIVYSATTAGQQPVVSTSQVVHIGVQIRQLDGTPIGYLNAKDFNVSVGGRSFPVSLTRPSLKRAVPDSVQTRLLLILPSPAVPGGPDILSEAIDQMNPVWREGWQVAVRTPQGGLTPYVASEQQLVQAIRQGPVTHSTDQAAIDTLKDFAGRRLVMAVWNGDYSMQYGMGNAAMGAQAMLYNIGGNSSDNYSYGEAVRGSTPSLPSYGEHVDGASAGPAAGGMTVVNNTETWSAPVQVSIDNVRAERSFRT